MKPKILYYIETIADFCIAKYIKENQDCEIYAIIDTNDISKKFFQKQKLLEFKKTWYYRDIVKNLDNIIDLKYLKEFEKKYDLNLWLIAYSERNFWNYNKYHKFTDKEILSIFEKEAKFFEKILEEVEFDNLIIKSPDQQQSQILNGMCKTKKIKSLTLSNCKFGFRYIISSKTHRLDDFQNTIKKYSDGKEYTINELQVFLKNWAKQRKQMKNKYGESSKQKIKWSSYYLRKVVNKEYQKYWVNFGRTRKKILLNETELEIKKKTRLKFIDKNLTDEFDQSIKYVYFPLHFQPERSTLEAAPFYENQIEVINQIARSIPIDFKVVVKEHPMQARNGWREKKYYEKIMDMPNVVLLHPSTNNEKILQNCQMVITIAGTLGLDALFHLKPAIVFSEVIYSELPGVFRVKSFEDLPKTIENALNFSINIKDLSQYTRCVLDNSFEHDDIKMAVLIQNEFYPGGHVYDMDISESKVVKFLSENKEMFENLSREYIKKIEEIK